MRRRKHHDPPPIGAAVFILVTGVILGNVFTFGEQYWNSAVDRQDAVCIEATFESYKEHFGRSSRGIDVYFFDHDQLHIDTSCVDDEVRDRIDALSGGMKVDLMVHPNSDTILDMRAGANHILDFDVAQKDLHYARTGFLGLGIFMYACAIYALGSLALRLCRFLHRTKKP